MNSCEARTTRYNSLSRWPCSMAVIAQRMTAVGKSNLAPIFLKRRFEGSSAAINGLECRWDLSAAFQGTTYAKMMVLQIWYCLSVNWRSFWRPATRAFPVIEWLWSSFTYQPNAINYQYWYDPERNLETEAKAVLNAKRTHQSREEIKCGHHGYDYKVKLSNSLPLELY